MVVPKPKGQTLSPKRASDVLVVGGGPAGLCLAAEVAKLGLSTTVVASRLGESWERSYGTFAKDVAASDLSAAVKRSFARPLVQVSGRDPVALSERYLRFDTGALQSLLFERAAIAGVRFLSGSVSSVEPESRSKRTVCNSTLLPGPGEGHGEARAVQLEAKLVVNAAGGALVESQAQGARSTGYQSAYGEWIEVAEHPFLAGEMSLMDYRPWGSARTDSNGNSDELPASFLYALPETGSARGPGTLFVQETVLSSQHPVPMSLLRERLLRRLDRLGLRRTRTLGTERCVIPLGGALPEYGGVMLPFGAAAGFVHPATGYQLATALQLAPKVARIVADRLHRGADDTVSAALAEMWPDDKRRAYRFYELGAATLATLSPSMMEEFIFDFFGLTGGRWQRFMAGSMGAAEIAETMWRIFARARGPLRAKLLREGSQLTSRLIFQKFN